MHWCGLLSLGVMYGGCGAMGAGKEQMVGGSSVGMKMTHMLVTALVQASQGWVSGVIIGYFGAMRSYVCVCVSSVVWLQGWRNIAPENRVFGAPSIRTDLPAPSKKSVSCMVNYGNEPDAMQVRPRQPRQVARRMPATRQA